MSRFALPALTLLVVVGCQTPSQQLTPETIRSSPAPVADQDEVLLRWELATKLANEFLASPFNQTLPSDSQLHLSATGMRFSAGDEVMPITLRITDDYRNSSCVCALVDTHRNVVHVRRPWDATRDLPIATCNTFFSQDYGILKNPAANLASATMKLVTILYYEKAAHISSWEWFKCQWLEWLLGSGHHRISMQHPNATVREFHHFWHGMEPPTPTLLQLLRTADNAEEALQRRRQDASSWQESFRELLRERAADE